MNTRDDISETDEAAIPLRNLDDGDLSDDALLDQVEKELGSDRYGYHRREATTDEGQDVSVQLVKKIVPVGDDPTLPTLTFRSLFIGVILCCVGAGVSQLFYFKSNAPSFSSFFVILISLPCGNMMATYLPHHRFQLTSTLGFDLNPGPYSIKEHVLTVIIAVSGASAAYAGDIIAVQDLFYKQDIGVVGGLLLLFTTQLIGLGIAGLVYDLLVRPTAMVWPSQLAVVTLFHTLHDKNDTSSGKRLRFFYIAFLATFLWQFVPALFAPTLTSMAILCIINNKSSVMRTLGSGYSGFGVLNLSFDWSVLGSVGGLVTPFWASLNYFVGLGAMVYVIAPMLYFGNVWNALSFPDAIDSKLYNSKFEIFDVSSVINPDLSLNVEAWEASKPLLLSPFFAITYGISFAVLTSAVATVFLWNRDAIVDALWSTKAPPDEHVEILEANYPSVPKSWYLVTGGSMLVLSVFLVLFWPLQLPVAGLFLSVAIAIFFLVPCGIIAATTETVIGLNVITEFIAGFLYPGLPIANVAVKCYGYMAMSQALTLVRDLKLGLYLKIPPREMFLCQALGTAIGSIVNYSFIKGIIAAKRDYLDGTIVDPSGQYTGRAPNIFYSASVIWGLVGPARFFSGQYSVLYWGFLVGLICPLVPWWVNKKWPAFGKKYQLHRISFPLIFHAMAGPPQIPTNVVIGGFLTAYFSQRWALRKHTKWFTKYNYVLSSALDAATSINAMVIYVFGLSALIGPSWWNSNIDTEHCRPGS